MTLETESGSELLEISATDEDGVYVISLSGEVDVSGAPLLREHLLAATQSGASEVVCDLTRLTYIDSTGISVLISARQRLRETGRELVLAGTAGRVYKVFEVTGVLPLFTIRPR